MGRQLAIDRGNSFTKLSVSENGVFQKTIALHDDQLRDALADFISSVNPEAIIISNVRDQFPFEDLFENTSAQIVRVSVSLKLPFSISYETPETLGHDRLANIAGAVTQMPGRNVLVIDCGSCITYSLLIKGTFAGGSISPGIGMRYRALHEFTGSLPLVDTESTVPAIPGRSTTDSIRTGVQRAILFETEAMIETYRAQFENLEVVLTGGDYSFFENNLKSRIFAHPELTRIGLHEILRINRS
ncbi:MAG: type III pantothenate kinase [Flavobacteriales bacterium]